MVFGKFINMQILCMKLHTTKHELQSHTFSVKYTHVLISIQFDWQDFTSKNAFAMRVMLYYAHKHGKLSIDKALRFYCYFLLFFGRYRFWHVSKLSTGLGSYPQAVDNFCKLSTELSTCYFAQWLTDIVIKNYAM